MKKKYIYTEFQSEHQQVHPADEPRIERNSRP